MSLQIDGEQLARLHAHAVKGYPHEVVGILAGNRTTQCVQRVEPLVNERADSPANRYKVGGLVLMDAEQALESEGFEIIGYYHSHPDHPSQYSDFDRDHALPNMSYLITSVVGGEIANTQSWRLLEDRSSMQEEAINVET